MYWSFRARKNGDEAGGTFLALGKKKTEIYCHNSQIIIGWGWLRDRHIKRDHNVGGKSNKNRFS